MYDSLLTPAELILLWKDSEASDYKNKDDSGYHSLQVMLYVYLKNC